MTTGAARGTVLDGTGGVWHVRLTGGEICAAALRGRVKSGSDTKLAVGDDVMVENTGGDGSLRAIAEILPRRSALKRREPGDRFGERVIAANVDQVVIVFAVARPDPHLRMLDRFLVIAEGNALSPRIVVNKIDLATTEDAAERFADYLAAGYPVHLTSKVTGSGLDQLRSAMSGASSVLTGPSGVGKSSLLNVMYPGLNLRVGEVSEAHNKGRHTTVGASLHPLPGEAGGYVVDSPGLREVGLWSFDPAELDQCFPEFRPSLGSCRFRDCTHRAEPNCAVREAVATGKISASRYDSYLKLREELEESEAKWQHSRARPTRRR